MESTRAFGLHWIHTGPYIWSITCFLAFRKEVEAFFLWALSSSSSSSSLHMEWRSLLYIGGGLTVLSNIKARAGEWETERQNKHACLVSFLLWLGDVET